MFRNHSFVPSVISDKQVVEMSIICTHSKEKDFLFIETLVMQGPSSTTKSKKIFAKTQDVCTFLFTVNI